MELKDYQSRVLADLAGYLDVLDATPNQAQAFTEHWVGKGFVSAAGADRRAWNRTRTRCWGCRISAPR